MPKKVNIPGEITVEKSFTNELIIKIKVKRMHIKNSWYNDRVTLENDGNEYELQQGDILKLTLDIRDIIRILGNLS